MKFLGVENELTQPMYDTVQLEAVANQTVVFYANPRGQALTGAINKTNSHTNMVEAGRLPSGWSMRLEAISFYVRSAADGGIATSKVDYDTIYQNGFIDFQIGQVSFLKTPITAIPPAGCESTYRSNITPAATEYSLNHGVGSQMNKFYMGDNPLLLEPQETLEIFLTIPGTIVAVTDVTFMLWGTINRPVR